MRVPRHTSLSLDPIKSQEQLLISCCSETRSYRHFEESDGVVNEVAEAISRAMVVDHRSMVGLVGKAANRGDNETTD